MRSFERLTLPAIAAVAFIAATSVHASTLVAEGVTYNLTGVALTSTTDEFTLAISGINGASDTEKGRAGVNAIAFGYPANFSSAVMITPAAGFDFQTGGLNSSGCDSTGNFFCFKANPAAPSTPALAANSSLTFVFDVTISSGSFTGWDPGFKIDWNGSKNNYNLVSLPLAPTFGPGPGPAPAPGDTPIPGALWLFGTVLAGGAGFGRWRKKRNTQLAIAA